MASYGGIGVDRRALVGGAIDSAVMPALPDNPMTNTTTASSRQVASRFGALYPDERVWIGHTLGRRRRTGFALGDETVASDANRRTGNQGVDDHEPAQALRSQQGSGRRRIGCAVGQAGRSAGQRCQQRLGDHHQHALQVWSQRVVQAQQVKPLRVEVVRAAGSLIVSEVVLPAENACFSSRHF